MSYARVFLRGWSRREWLTVLVVAVTAAFLLGTALLLASAGAYTETLEDDLSGTATATEYDSLAEATAAADSDSILVPLATAEVQGETVTVAGIPADAPTVLSGASVDWREARFPDVADAAIGPVSEPTTVRFVGDAGSVERRVSPSVASTPSGETETILPPWWYATSTATVEELGVTSVIVFDPSGGVGGAVPTGRAAPPGAPLIAALPFLLAGIRQLLTVLSIAALGGGVLVSVVVYSVSRMAIRDRYDDIRVVRATGGSPSKLFVVLCARATTLVVAGVALGYAFGVVFTNAITNLAIVAGLPVSLSGTVTPAVARLLVVLSSILVLAGVVAGALAAWPAIRTPPARLRAGGRTFSAGLGGLTARWSTTKSKYTDGGSTSASNESAETRRRTRLLEAVRPDLLDVRAVIPTTATLTVFVFIVLLVGSLWGAFVPLSSTQSGTIVEAGAAHPLNSRVDADTAELLRSQGINASAEVIYAAVSDGEPFLVRGAEYDAFRSVSDIRLVAGREPVGREEAVIGQQLARTLDVDVGETLLLGGSITPGIRHVTVVGVYESDGPLDNMLVVPFDSVGELAAGGGQAHIIRTENLSAAQQALVSPSGESGVVVTGVNAPTTVVQGESFDVTVSVRNLDDSNAQSTLTVRTNNESFGQQTVRLDPGATREVTIPVSVDEPGPTTLSVEGYTTRVEVLDPSRLSIPDELPDRAPPGARLIVPAQAVNGSFVSNATIDVDGESFRTGSQGVAIVRLPDEPGTYDLRVRKPGFSGDSAEIRIQEGASRELSARLRVRPETGNALTTPQIDVEVANPWDRALERNLTLVSRSEAVTRSVDLDAGEAARVNVTASEIGFAERLPPGTYEIRLVSEGASQRVLTTATYTVRGDERVLSVVASGGQYAPGTPVGQAIENVFGNVQVLFGAIVLLAGFATIGGTTAAFAQAVHARGRSLGIRRATGATPRQVLVMLLGDACRLALPSTVLAVGLALAAMALLEASGVLVLFGIRLSIPAVPWVIAMVVVGGVALSAASVVVAAVGFLRVPPARLLRLRE